MFGGAVLADNDPDYHEKIVKFNELLADCAIYSTTLDLTATANELSREGWAIDPDDLVTVTPYITSAISRFVDWVLDLDRPPRPATGTSRSPTPDRFTSFEVGGTV